MGLLFAVLALLVGPAVSPVAALYPAGPHAAVGSIVVDGDTVTACGTADPAVAYSMDVDGVEVASGTTEADGSYCVTAPVPAGLAAGTHEATFTSDKDGAAFSLSASFLRAAGSELPRTGRDSAATVRLAIMLVSAGALLLALLSVRRRTQSKA